MRILSQGVRGVALCLELGEGKIHYPRGSRHHSPPLLSSSRGFRLARSAGPGFGRGTRKEREAEWGRRVSGRRLPPPPHIYKVQALPEPSGLGWEGAPGWVHWET